MAPALPVTKHGQSLFLSIASIQTTSKNLSCHLWTTYFGRFVDAVTPKSCWPWCHILDISAVHALIEWTLSELSGALVVKALYGSHKTNLAWISRCRITLQVMNCVLEMKLVTHPPSRFPSNPIQLKDLFATTNLWMLRPKEPGLHQLEN